MLFAALRHQGCFQMAVSEAHGAVACLSPAGLELHSYKHHPALVTTEVLHTHSGMFIEGDHLTIACITPAFTSPHHKDFKVIVIIWSLVNLQRIVHVVLDDSHVPYPRECRARPVGSSPFLWAGPLAMCRTGDVLLCLPLQFTSKHKDGVLHYCPKGLLVFEYDLAIRRDKEMQGTRPPR